MAKSNRPSVDLFFEGAQTDADTFEWELSMTVFFDPIITFEDGEINIEVVNIDVYEDARWGNSYGQPSEEEFNDALHEAVNDWFHDVDTKIEI